MSERELQGRQGEDQALTVYPTGAPRADTAAPAVSGLSAIKPSPSSAEAVLAATVRRAISVVRAETAALRETPNADLAPFEHRKSQVLLDLSRARGALTLEEVSEEIEILLQDLRVSLAENMTILDRHMKAVQEVSDLLSRVMLEADSDGTYRRPAHGGLDD
ncbi:hypothetical protein GCM10011316_27280 [Roseibium aquae]|uniref:Uncharacterized protein n=1 Tax=Roseibium aquae TaxID=1323746 RepID=A0A916X165_9HYPH|nr:hypothetical protein [Roseibium aquae]GGB53789.1 hypothetical protein GCM10011316_27280 [Roseibium aquae]